VEVPSNVVDDADRRIVPAEPIDISSDEDVLRTSGKGGKAIAGATLRPAPNGRAKGKGKATATVKRKKVQDVDEGDALEHTTVPTEDNVMSQRDMTSNLKGKNRDRLRHQVDRLQKQLEDVCGLHRSCYGTEITEGRRLPNSVMPCPVN